MVNVYFIIQKGRLAYEAVLALASLRQTTPDFTGQIYVIEPQPGPLWPEDPRVDGPVRDLLARLCDVWLPLESQIFGANYPHGNKIEALSLLPQSEPFIFFDSDTVFYKNLQGLTLDFTCPTASHLSTNTWPKPQPAGPSLEKIWQSLYDRFDLDFRSALDISCGPDDWRRYPYYNAGWFYGHCPQAFGALFADMAQSVWTNPPPELHGQNLYPWLDQIVLPLVLHALGGGRVSAPQFDQDYTYHYRYLARTFAHGPICAQRMIRDVARQPHIARILAQYPPFYRFLYDNYGATAAAIGQNVQRGDETALRLVMEQAGLWNR